jgi:hypothetical protein
MKSRSVSLVSGVSLIAAFVVAAASHAQDRPRKDDPLAKEAPGPKEKLLKSGSGPTVEDAAISRGLAWLARQQLDDGSWQFDITDSKRAKEQSRQVAATGLALLPFLAAGEGPTEAKKYQKVVKTGIDWLASWGPEDGFIAKDMYAQAIATTALCDAYRLSRDERLKAKAALAVGYVVKAQGKNGSWGYKARTEGDTSITGWQIEALASAVIAGIEFDRSKVYKRADSFLESVSDNSGATYGYREKGKSQALTAVGLLSRYSMGTLAPTDAGYAKGVEFLKKLPPQEGAFDMYYLYYATCVIRIYGGDDWRKFWKPKVWGLLTELQDNGADDATRGSWRKDLGFIGVECGRLGTTSLAVLTLQVENRYHSLKKDGGVKDVEK